MSNQEVSGAKSEVSGPKESKINRVVREMLLSGKPLNQETVYSVLASELTIDEIQNKVTDDLGDLAPEVLERVTSAIGPEGIRLLVEPAILTRNEELLTYMREQEVTIHTKADVAVVREGFRKYLGTKKVYRTQMHDAEQLKQIVADGFVASYIRQVGGATKIVELQTGYDSVGYNITDLRGRVHVHTHGDQRSFSTLISLSSYLEISKYGCFTAISSKLDEYQSKGFVAFTFPIMIDELATIRYGKYLPRKFTSEKNWVYKDTRIPYEDTGVELFAEFAIEPTKIEWDEVTVTALDELPIFHLE